MIKIKPVIICASVAFVLSFFTALIARTGLPISLLKAVIFSVLFGGIAVGVQIVYDKFLAEGEAPAQEVVQQQRTVGGKVDLVVSEEDLPSDNEAPSFALDSKRHVLKAEDIGIRAENARPQHVPASTQSAPAPAAAPEAASSAPSESPAKESYSVHPAAESAAPNSGFVPQDLAKPGEPIPPMQGGQVQSGELPELDDFPGLGGGDDVGAKPAEDKDIIEDSDFAEEGSVKPSRQTEFPDGKIADPKDASLMAEAIRTVLTKEE